MTTTGCQRCLNIIKFYKLISRTSFVHCTGLSTAPVKLKTSLQSRNFSSTPPKSSEFHTTVDQNEHDKFLKLSSQWWDEKGEYFALHSMNKLRIPLIRDGMVESTTNKIFPLKDKVVLDVGSGGGIIAEPLARLGATVVGIDMVEENIKVAQTHISQDPSIMDRVKYIHGAVEDLVGTEEEKFDAVVASEVVEHVSDVGAFLSSCCKLIKPGGSMFITTLNKTSISYGLAVFGAERILRVVPPGTHDWNKFIPPEDLQEELERSGMVVRLVHGMCYNPFNNQWSWITNTDINYAVHAIKPVDSMESNNTQEEIKS